MRSADGSITEFMSSLTVATGLNGGGGGALLQPKNSIALTETMKGVVRIGSIFSPKHGSGGGANRKRMIGFSQQDLRPCPPVTAESRVYGGSTVKSTARQAATPLPVRPAAPGASGSRRSPTRRPPSCFRTVHLSRYCQIPTRLRCKSVLFQVLHQKSVYETRPPRHQNCVHLNGIARCLSYRNVKTSTIPAFMATPNRAPLGRASQFQW